MYIAKGVEVLPFHGTTNHAENLKYVLEFVIQLSMQRQSASLNAYTFAISFLAEVPQTATHTENVTGYLAVETLPPLQARIREVG